MSQENELKMMKDLMWDAVKHLPDPLSPEEMNELRAKAILDAGYTCPPSKPVSELVPLTSDKTNLRQIIFNSGELLVVPKNIQELNDFMDEIFERILRKFGVRREYQEIKWPEKRYCGEHPNFEGLSHPVYCEICKLFKWHNYIIDACQQALKEAGVSRRRKLTVEEMEEHIENFNSMAVGEEYARKFWEEYRRNLAKSLVDTK